MKKKVLLLIGSFILICNVYASEKKIMYYTVEINGTDTIVSFILPEVVCFNQLGFKNEKERIAYTKLVRDVKIALPYAKKISSSIIETYEMMQTFGNEKEKEQYMKNVQKYMMDEYKPKMKKMTRNQGVVLVKLIDRETNSSSYDIVKALIGSFKAGFYNTFAKLFGNNLKTKYDPNGKDALIERIVIEVEQGTI